MWGKETVPGDTAYPRGKQPRLIILKISKINLPWDWHSAWISSNNLSLFYQICAVYPFIILVMAAPKHTQRKSKIALICAVRIWLGFSFLLPSLLMIWKIHYTQGWLFWPALSSSLSFVLLWEGLTLIGLVTMKSVEQIAEELQCRVNTWPWEGNTSESTKALFSEVMHWKISTFLSFLSVISILIPLASPGSIWFFFFLATGEVAPFASVRRSSRSSLHF